MSSELNPFHETLTKQAGVLQRYTDVFESHGAVNAEQWYLRASSQDREKFDRFVDGVRKYASQPDSRPASDLLHKDRSGTNSAKAASITGLQEGQFPFKIQETPGISRSTTNRNQYQFWVPDLAWRAEEAKRTRESGLRLQSSTRGKYTCAEEDENTWKGHLKTSYEASHSKGSEEHHESRVRKTLFNTGVDDPANEILLAEHYAKPMIRTTHHNALERYVRDNGSSSQQEFTEVLHKISNFQKKTESRTNFVQHKPQEKLKPRHSSSSLTTDAVSLAKYDEIQQAKQRVGTKLASTLPRLQDVQNANENPQNQRIRPRSPKANHSVRPPWAGVDGGSYMRTSQSSRNILANGYADTVSAMKVYGTTTAAIGRVLPNYQDHLPYTTSMPNIHDSDTAPSKPGRRVNF